MLDTNRRKAEREQQSILQVNKQLIITLLDAVRYLTKQGLAFGREPKSQGINMKPSIIHGAFKKFPD